MAKQPRRREKMTKSMARRDTQIEKGVVNVICFTSNPCAAQHTASEKAPGLLRPLTTQGTSTIAKFALTLIAALFLSSVSAALAAPRVL